MILISQLSRPKHLNSRPENFSNPNLYFKIIRNRKRFSSMNHCSLVFAKSSFFVISSIFSLSKVKQKNQRSKIITQWLDWIPSPWSSKESAERRRSENWDDSEIYLMLFGIILQDVLFGEIFIRKEFLRSLQYRLCEKASNWCFFCFSDFIQDFQDF